jgi:hypothetical protein
MIAWKLVDVAMSEAEYWAYVPSVPELPILRVKPVPAVAVPVKLLVPTIPSRKAPVWKETADEVEIAVPVPEPVDVANPAVVTPETS